MIEQEDLKKQLLTNIKQLVDAKEAALKKFAPEYRNEIAWYLHNCDGQQAKIIGYLDDHEVRVKTVEDLVNYIVGGK